MNPIMSVGDFLQAKFDLFNAIKITYFLLSSWILESCR